MRAVAQRVSQAGVTVAGQEVGRIGAGLLVLLGVGQNDGPEQARWLATKIAGLRVFPDADDKLNLSVLEVGGEVLVVSQFTLWADCSRGKRPSFARAAAGQPARELYELFVESLRGLGLPVATGSFGAMMDVSLVNQGPVTLLLDTEKSF